MRKIIVKYFALNYICKIFGKEVTFLRSATIIAPLFIISGLSLETSVFPYVFGLCILSLFFGFVYFDVRPIKWNELDDFQKLQYGIAAKSGKLTKNIEFTESMQQEWVNIKADLENKLNSVRNHKLLLAIIYNPFVLLILSLIIAIIVYL